MKKRPPPPAREPFFINDALNPRWESFLRGLQASITLETSITSVEHSLIVGDSSGDFTPLDVGASDEVLQGNTGADPTWETTPTITSATFNGLTATRLMATNSSKVAVSADISAWISGTTDQVIVTDDGDGTVTLSLADPLITPGDVTVGGSLIVTNNANNIIEQQVFS
jgi:hypothetical protein